MTKIEIGIVVVIVALLGLAIAGGASLVDEKKRFMASCTEHEADYQCEVKWKQMHPDPLVVYAPLNK